MMYVRSKISALISECMAKYQNACIFSAWKNALSYFKGDAKVMGTYCLILYCIYILQTAWKYFNYYFLA